MVLQIQMEKMTAWKNKEGSNRGTGARPEYFSPVYSSVVVVPIEELDLLKCLFAGIVAHEVRVQAQEQIQSSCPWYQIKWIKNMGGKKSSCKQAWVILLYNASLQVILANGSMPTQQKYFFFQLSFSGKAQCICSENPVGGALDTHLSSVAQLQAV